MATVVIRGLKASPFAKVYDEVVSILKADSTLATVVRNWQAWDGGSADLIGFEAKHCPYLVLTPRVLQGSFWGPSDFRATLVVDIVAGVAGTRAASSFDLHWAVMKALYPADADKRAAIHRRLQAVGLRAEYTVEFGGEMKPISDPDASYHESTSMIRLPVLELLNP